MKKKIENNEKGSGIAENKREIPHFIVEKRWVISIEAY
jgi:hypothetical protein